MKTIRISDETLKQKDAALLTFKQKLDLVKLLDRMQADVIETDLIKDARADALAVKSFAQTVEHSIICVPVELNEESVEAAYEAVKRAKYPRLQVACPVSTVRMEYGYRLKAAGMKEKAVQIVKACRALCEDVEFEALDASRSEPSFLYDILNACIEAGAGTVTVSDDAGNMLPHEYEVFLTELKQHVDLSKASLGIRCSSELAAADILSFTGAAMGASEIKVSSFAGDTASFMNTVKLIKTKGETADICTGVRTVEMKRILTQIDCLFTDREIRSTPFDDKQANAVDENAFTSSDDIRVIRDEVCRLGYDLPEDDVSAVFEQFQAMANKKATISSGELEAIIASTAMQVPPAYRIEDYIINSGHALSSSAQIVLVRDGKRLENISLGDGPIDAAFKSIEQITGHHYELDDILIRSVTEGREAMGEAVVKLRAGGRLYSGRGLSTDIIGSSIRAYINALNKIVYEEEL